uniref:Putative secreted protein n=2 Tax=Anopheles triannulatus TaxID=58253 RepID=A0A2M4AWJ2_9DIPT
MQLPKTVSCCQVVTMVVVLLLAVLTVGGHGAHAQSDPDPAKANRNSLLLRRGNVGQRPIGGRTTPTTTSTTTTTVSPDYAEDEYADNYDEGKGEAGDGGEPAVTTTTTTTEAPKKIRPSIRPFRSNDDLLTALKKRRQESKNNKPATALPKDKTYDDEEVPAVQPAAPAPKPAKAPAIGKIADNIVFSFTKPSNKRRFGSGASRRETESEQQQQGGEQQQGGDEANGTGAKSLIGRLGRSRFALKQ